MTNNRIVIDAKPRTQIPLSLVGQEYLVLPPKGSLGIKIAQRAQEANGDPMELWGIVESYIDIAFGKKQGKEIKKRLEDEDDDLDIAHLMQVIEKLTEFVTDDPTS